MPDPAQVNQHFSDIAPGYDRANHLLSGGFDFLWRRSLTNRVKSKNPKTILDLATGSGDVAFSLKKHIPNATITGLDFCQPMLDQAEIKKNNNLLDVSFIQGDCHNLPFPHNSFDAITISFGYRNLANRPQALQEFHRTLTPGGHLYILEFSQPYKLIAPLYFWYLNNILPHIAKLVTGNKSAYNYLSDSIESFPPVNQIASELHQANFSSISYIRPTLGIVAIHQAAKH